MLFMNESEIHEAVRRHQGHPVLRKAALLLLELMNLANQVSDGWAYWPKPCRAAKKLQELIQKGTPDTTEADLRKAVAPIKAFLTRERKDNWPQLNLPY